MNESIKDIATIDELLVQLEMKKESLKAQKKRLMDQKNHDIEKELETFQQNLKFILKKMRITQSEIANKCSVSRPTMNKIINSEGTKSQIRLVFMSLLKMAAESDNWNILYIWYYKPGLFEKMTKGNQLSEKEIEEVKRDIEYTWIPFGEYKIPKGLFNMMMS